MALFLGVQAATWLTIGLLFVLTVLTGVFTPGYYAPPFDFLARLLGSRVSLTLMAVTISSLMLFAYHFSKRRQSSGVLSRVLIANVLLPVTVCGLSLWQQPIITEQTLVGFYRNKDLLSIKMALFDINAYSEVSIDVSRKFWQIVVCENFDLDSDLINQLETKLSDARTTPKVSCVTPSSQYKTALDYLIAKEAPLYAKRGQAREYNFLFGYVRGSQRITDAEIQSLLKAGRKDVLCDSRYEERFKKQLGKISCP